MNDEKIFKICVITSIIGLLGIMCLTSFVLPEQLEISDVDKSKINNNVEVNATITNIITTKSGTRIVTLTDNSSSINLVIFSSTLLEFELKKGQKVSVVGKVSEYKGDVELILEESSNIKAV